VQNIKLADIRPYWRNPRKNEAAVEAVKQSIKDYGFNSPLVVDKEMVIIAGHTRYKALMQLGWDAAPCVVVDLPAQKAKEYRIADNKTSELAEWDMDNLIPELREIQGIGDFQIYFPDISLNNLIEETAGAVNFSLPSAENIARVQEAEGNKFQEMSEKTQYVKIMCPHCGEESFVDRAEIMRQPATETPDE